MTKFIGAVLTVLLVTFQMVLTARAYCLEPQSPDVPGTFNKPDVPYCLSEFSYSGKHSCKSYEIDSYKSEVDEYILKLKNYASEAEDYYNDAVSYAKCEIEAVLEQHK